MIANYQYSVRWYILLVVTTFMSLEMEKIILKHDMDT